VPGKGVIRLGDVSGRGLDRVWLPGKKIGDVCAAAAQGGDAVGSGNI